MGDDPRHAFGKEGEALACAALRRRGYAILQRGYRTRVGEIDIVAREGDAIVFVEVKARMDDRFGGAAAAVTPAKQYRLTQVALDYLSRHRLHDRPCRFDVVTVEVRADGAPRIDVFVNAFEAAW